MKTIVVFILFLTYFLPAQAQRKYQLLIEPSVRTSGYERAKKHEWPLVFLAADLQYDTVGTPILLLLAQNTTMKAISEYSFQVFCFNESNQPVFHQKSESRKYDGKSEELLQALNDVYFPEVFMLNGYKKTSRVKIYLTHVEFWDGTSWTPKNQEATMIESALARSYDVVDNK